VSFRDLDLSNPEEVKTLYRRIQRAARQVCGYESYEPIEQLMWRECYKAAIANAVAKVRSPLLTAENIRRPVPRVSLLGEK
jgi:UrcA family protein